MMELFTLAQVIYKAFSAAKNIATEWEKLPGSDQETFIKIAGSVAVHNTLNLLSHVQNVQNTTNATTESQG